MHKLNITRLYIYIYIYIYIHLNTVQQLENKQTLK